MTTPIAPALTPLNVWLSQPIGGETWGNHLHTNGYRNAARVGRTAVVINPSKPYGFGEHDEHGELGGLWFNALRVLTDYDGVFSLHLEYAAAIELLGYTISEHCTSDNLEAEAKKAGGYLALAKLRGLSMETAELLPFTATL